MAMQIIHLLEEIHVNHEKDQIAMVQLTNVVALNPLVASQDLSGFCRQNFFEVAAVPYACHCIGVRNLLQFQILPLQFETVPAKTLFFILQFIFQLTHLIEILAREAQQVEQLPVHPVLLKEHQQTHEEHRRYRQKQPIGTHTRWRSSSKLCPCHHERRGKYGH